MATRTRHDKPADEWLRQAGRDRRAAEHLFEGGFYEHATVLAHLAVEKALKGLYRAQKERNPPVTHNLSYLADRTKLVVPDDLRDALDALSDEHILNLYPDRLFDDEMTFNRSRAQDRLDQSQALLDWITDHV